MKSVEPVFEAVGQESLRGIKLILSSRQGIQKNSSDLKNEVRKRLFEVLPECNAITTEECAQRASAEGITVDENDPACIQGKKLAEDVFGHMKDKQLADCKNTLLPLQGREWMAYNRLLKKEHRDSSKSASIISGIRIR